MPAGKLTSRDYIGVIGVILSLLLVSFIYSLVGRLGGVENTAFRISSVGGIAVSVYLLITRKTAAFMAWVRSRQGQVTGIILLLVFLTLLVLWLLQLGHGWIVPLFWAFLPMYFITLLIPLCDEFAQFRRSRKRDGQDTE